MAWNPGIGRSPNKPKFPLQQEANAVKSLTLTMHSVLITKFLGEGIAQLWVLTHINQANLEQAHLFVRLLRQAQVRSCCATLQALKWKELKGKLNEFERARCVCVCVCEWKWKLYERHCVSLTVRSKRWFEPSLLFYMVTNGPCLTGNYIS